MGAHDTPNTRGRRPAAAPSTSEFIVSSVTVRRRRKGGERISFGISTDADDGTWYPTDGYTLAAWRVRCVTQAEAAGIVMHWLATDKPSTMDVRQVFPSQHRPVPVTLG